MMKALERAFNLLKTLLLSSMLMAKQITESVSIDVESEDNVTTVNNYYGADKSINEISFFEPFLSETQLSFQDLQMIRYLFGSIRMTDRKSQRHCSGGKRRF